MRKRMLRLTIAIALAAVSAVASFGETEIRSVIVEGRGATREEAMVDAFAEALRQVNGVKLDLSRELNGVFSESATSADGATSARSTTVSSTISERVKTATKGAIRSYEVDSIDRDPDGSYSVHLRANVATYVSPGLPTENRRKIVVWPFASAAPGFPFANGRIPAGAVKDDILGAVNRDFTQSRRFAVLSRQGDDAAAIRGERTLITEESPVEEMAKLGQTLGADYLVCGTIRNVSVMPIGTGPGYEAQRSLRASITVDYRIITVATAQMKWADSVSLVMGPDEIATCGNDEQTVYRTLVDATSRGIVSSALENIYPVSVVSVNGNGELVLDQGAGLVRPGTLYEVFRLGEEIFGRNGESLGREETKIGTIQIVRSDPKLSYGKLVSDDGRSNAETVVTKNDVAVGIVVRPSRSPARNARKNTAPAAQQSSEIPVSGATAVRSSVYPVAVGLTPPVQTGGDNDDVCGLDFGLLWARHRNVAGFAFGSFGHQALGAMEGWQLSTLYNESGDGSAGLQTTGIVNLGNGSFSGLQLAGCANVVFGDVQGCQLSSLVNLSEKFDGLQLSVANIATDVSGVQLGVYNQGDVVRGLQIGVVNMAKTLYGVQIGLSNYVEDSPLPWFPVINICF